MYIPGGLVDGLVPIQREAGAFGGWRNPVEQVSVVLMLSLPTVLLGAKEGFAHVQPGLLLDELFHAGLGYRSVKVNANSCPALKVSRH